MWRWTGGRKINSDHGILFSRGKRETLFLYYNSLQCSYSHKTWKNYLWVLMCAVHLCEGFHMTQGNDCVSTTVCVCVCVCVRLSITPVHVHVCVKLQDPQTKPSASTKVKPDNNPPPLCSISTCKLLCTLRCTKHLGQQRLAGWHLLYCQHSNL